MRGGVRPGAVPLAIVVQSLRQERAACLRRGFGRQAALRPLVFFHYECYFRTRIYLVASGLPFNLPNPWRDCPGQRRTQRTAAGPTAGAPPSQVNR